MPETEQTINQRSKNILEKSVERSTGETIEYLRDTPPDEIRKNIEVKTGSTAKFPSYWPNIGRRFIPTISREEIEEKLNRLLGRVRY